MGLLAVGTPLQWPEAKKNAHQVRDWGIQQLLAIWNRAKGKEKDALLWGDEVEYLVVTYSESDPKVTLSLRQADILMALAEDDKLATEGGCVPELQDVTNARGNALPVFHPEFGRYMLESTPGKPWGIDFKDLLDVEPNMKWRREIAKEHMNVDEYPITLTTYPRLGAPGTFTTPWFATSGEKLRSQFVPDEIANPHIRFPTLAANIRSRRGRKVQVNVPVFRDINTPWPWKDPTVNYDLHKWPEDDDVRNGAAPDNFIHMDAMAFGMGSCCLQITFQAKNITEGRIMYDQLSPLGPILLALTAATPIYKGFLADTDIRWNQISRAVDDRTPEELGEVPLKNDRWRIPKSRYASNSTYISEDPRLRNEYLDPNLIIDADVKQELMKGGMDDRLATHFAHLFIRDPIVIFSEDLKDLDLTKTDHFENLQSTNWQHIRFKPPPASNDIGWRVEFRPMEIQITDFENAAFSVFMVLITRAILSFDLNFYIPITKVSDNMEMAHARDAVLEQKFYFRKNPFTTRVSRPYSSNGPTSGDTTPAISRPQTPAGPVEDEYDLMSINEIMNGGKSGSGNDFPGLIPLVESYLDSVNIDVQTRCELAYYLDLIRKRADGSLWTAAKWIRHFVGSHEEYKHDSVVNDQINHDLIGAVIAIESGDRKNAIEITNSKSIVAFLCLYLCICSSSAEHGYSHQDIKEEIEGTLPSDLKNGSIPIPPSILNFLSTFQNSKMAHASPTFLSTLSPTTGILSDPNNAEFQASMLRWSTLDLQIPSLIIQPSSAADILATVMHCTEHKIPFVVKSGGHSPWSTISSRGWIIDLALWKGMQVDEQADRVRIWGSISTSELNVELGPTPNSGSVAIIPFLLGGGRSPLSSLHGLGIDNIISAKIITASSPSSSSPSLLSLSETENRDLFWAIKGAGQYFGLVTEVELKIHPLREIGVDTFIFAAEKVGEVTGALERIVQGCADTEAGTGIVMKVPFAEKPVIIITTTNFSPSSPLSSTQALTSLNPLKHIPKNINIAQFTSALDAVDKHGSIKRYLSIGLQRFKPDILIKGMSIFESMVAEGEGLENGALFGFDWGNSEGLRKGGEEGEVMALSTSPSSSPSQTQKSFSYADQYLAMCQEDQAESEKSWFQNNTREHPVQLRYRDEKVRKRLRELKKVWDPRACFGEEFL
ncbi:hypothetical protein B7494_g7783 [Chlorociboria aeruginascens]|nr:hypothetical protein B7494_g7783 [Chlorociboria aeruginascens]